jgi:hypothetical protein
MKTLFCLSLLAWPLLATAQITESRYVFGAGGGPATAGVYALTDTAGQPVVGTSGSATYAVADGFWPEPGDAPVAAAMSLGAIAGQATTLQTLKLLLRSSDPNGETLRVVAVSAVSTNGNSVVLNTNAIYYFPAAGHTGADAFSYIIADTGGDTASGIVTVTVSAGGGSSGGSYNHLAVVPVGSNVRVSFLGIPGLNYALDVTHDLTAPITWTPVVTNPAAANGLLVFTNTPSGGQSFYRTRYVP